MKVSGSAIPAKKLRLVYCLAALAAFLAGIAIYALFRNIDNMVLFRYFRQPSFLAAPRIAIGTDTILGYLFVFNLPHGLWALSGLLVIRAVWLTDTRWRAVYAGMFVAAASTIELMQLGETMPGTFDVLDLASYGIAAFLESVVYSKFTKRRFL